MRLTNDGFIFWASIYHFFSHSGSYIDYSASCHTVLPIHPYRKRNYHGFSFHWRNQIAYLPILWHWSCDRKDRVILSVIISAYKQLFSANNCFNKNQGKCIITTQSCLLIATWHTALLFYLYVFANLLTKIDHKTTKKTYFLSVLTSRVWFSWLSRKLFIIYCLVSVRWHYTDSKWAGDEWKPMINHELY